VISAGVKSVSGKADSRWLSHSKARLSNAAWSTFGPALTGANQRSHYYVTLLDKGQPLSAQCALY